MTVSGTENGKSNTPYDNSSGIIHMSCNGNTGLSKGGVIMPNNRAIGCVNETSIPFTRVKCLVDENGTMHTIMSDSSSTELVVNDHKGRSLLHHKQLRRFLLMGLLLLFGVLIIVLTVLYVEESERTKQVRIVKVLDKWSPDCFVRATPRQIEHVKKEKEIADASKRCDIDIRKTIQEGTFHAVSLSVSYMGQKIWSFTHGQMNYSYPNSSIINEDTPFPIASISKVFTVIMLRKLIDMQVIKNIDDEIVKYHESFVVNNPFNQDNITFRQLACMMSGLPREAPCYSAESETSNDTRKDKHNMCPFNSDDMLKKLRKVSLVVRPGSEPSYSNLALGILGDVLMRLLKNQTLEEWVMQNIIEKLGMTNTGYIIGKNNSKFPVSSVNSKKAPIMDWGWLRSAAGMYSSVNDLGKLGIFFLEGVKSLLNKQQVDGLLKPAYIWSDGYAQGCPFEMQPMYLDKISSTHNQMNYISYQKGGYIFGYGSLFKLIPALQLNINGLVASPIEGAADELTTIVCDRFTAAFDKLLKRKKPEYKLPPNAEAFVGSYRLRTFWPLINRPCNITLENNILVLNIEWLRASLSQKSKWTLVSGNLEDVRCVILGIGLLRDEYMFIEPKSKSGKSPGFVVNSISSSGYLRFDRIEG